MIKNILFDMGNVLIRFEPKQYVKNAGLSESDQQLLLRELYGSIDWVRLDRGTLTEAEVIDRCVSRVGEHLRGAVEKLVGHWDRPELPVEGMKALTDELYEKGYGLYLLTNAGPRQREYWPRFRAGEHFPEERVYRSADVHLLKPDPAFFEGALEKFGLNRAECVFIDRRADAVKLIQENLTLCRLADRARVRQGDALPYLRSGEKFDIVFLDPPYASGLLQQALTDIAAFDICRAHGIIIAESAVDTVLPEMPAPYALYREYKYGKIKLTVYHRGGNEDTE